MYAHGGVSAVEAFQMQRCRQKISGGSSISYEDDYFYRGDEINPEILMPLETIRQVGAWAESCVQIIHAMLQIEPSKRPSAHLVEYRLFQTVLRELNKDHFSSQLVASRGPYKIGQKQHGDEEREIHESNAKDIPIAPVPSLQQHGSGEVFAQENSSGSSASDWDSNSPEPLAPSPTYGTGDFTGSIYQIACSASSEYIASLTEENVYIYTNKLSDEDPRYPHEPIRENIRMMEGTFLVIRAPEKTIWRSMSLSGNYLAISGYNQSDQQGCVS